MRAKRTGGEKKGTGTRKEQKGEGNRKEPEARGLDQEDVRPGRSGEAQAKAGGPGPAHARGHFPFVSTGRAAVRRGTVRRPGQGRRRRERRRGPGAPGRRRAMTAPGCPAFRYPGCSRARPDPRRPGRMDGHQLSGMEHLAGQRHRSERRAACRYEACLAWMTTVPGQLQVWPDFLEYALFPAARRSRQRRQDAPPG